eukprot:11487363-Karenia_brevis.AAC.1
MADGATVAAAGAEGLVAQPQVPGLQNPEPDQGRTQEGEMSKKQLKIFEGIRICGVNITSSSKKANCTGTRTS